MRLVIRTSDRKQELSDFGWTLAQVPGSDGSPLKIADIAGVDLFVYDKADTSTVLYSVTLQPAQVFFDSLQLSPRWTEDTRGYNFAHYLTQQSVFPVNSQTVIERGGHTYRLEYRINTVNAGLVWVIRESTVSPVVSTSTATGGGGGGGNADFSITLTPSSTTIFAGFQQDILVHITGLNGFLGTVNMTAASASGTIPGATLTWIPNPSIIANGDGTLRIAIDANAGVAGSYTVNVTGSYNTLTHTVPLTLQVQQVGGGSQGWSTFAQIPANNDLIFYVSFSTGSDSNNGLAGTTGGGNGPKKTLAAGLALLRNGHADWLLLNKGDTWAEKIGNFSKSGRDFNKNTNGDYTGVMRIGAYGTGARPKIATTQALGDMMFAAQGTPPSPNASFLAFTEIEFTVSDYDGTGLVHNQKGTTLLNLNGGQVGFLMEGCWLHNAWQLMTIFPGGGQTTRGSNQIFRRNLFTEAYSRDCTNMGSTVQPSGAYIEGVDGLLFEENFWDNCGWIDGDDTTRVIDGSLGGNLYRHVIYVQNGVTGILWKGNIACRTDAVLCRGGGIIRDNLFLQLATGLVFGDGAFAAQNDPFGVSGIVRGNAWLGNSNLSEYNNPGISDPAYSHTDWRGWAFGTSNTVSLDLSYNIIAHSNLNNSESSPTGGFPFAFRMNFIDNSTNGNPQGLNNVTMDNNVVYKWPSFGGNSTGGTGFYSEGPVHNFIWSNNRISEDGLPGPDGRATHICDLRHTPIGAGGEFHSGGNLVYKGGGGNLWFNTGSWDNPSGGPDIVEMTIDQFKAAVAGLNGAASDTTTVAGTSATLNFPAPDTANMPGYMATIGGPNTLQDFINGCKTQSKDSYQDKWTANAVLTYIRAGFGVVVPP